jgi:two-component system sensor kinase FixL
MKPARKGKLNRDRFAAAKTEREFRRAGKDYHRLEDEHHLLEDEYRLRHKTAALNDEEWAEDKTRLLQVQHELELSREIYAHLFDFAPVGYVTLTRAGWMREVNLTAARLLGMPRELLLKSPLMPLVVTEDRRRFLNYLVKLRMAPGTITADFRFKQDGTDELTLQCVSESSPNIRSTEGTIRIALVDITARKQSEQALVESEERFRLMADAAPVLIWVASSDKLWTYVNRPWLKFTGRTLEQEKGNGWLESVHPEDRHEFLARYSIAFETRQEFKLECRLRRHDGEYRWMLNHGVPRFASANQLSGYICSCIDITERRRAEEILRHAHDELESRVRERTAELAKANADLKTEMAERQQAEMALFRLAAIVESSSDAIVGEDQEGRITSWNPAAEKVFGYTAAEILGHPFKVLVPAELHKHYRKVRRRLMVGDLVDNYETVRVRKGGGRIQVAMTVSPVKGPAGEVVGTSAIVRDISRRKRLENEVVRISEREQQRIARDLHEGLCQELAGISCLSNTLKEKLTARRAKETADAEKISHLLDTTVAQSRDLAHGLQPVAPEPNALMSVLENLAARVTELFKVVCRFECPGPVPIKDNAMATHLYRIAQEAATNAIRHGQAQRIEIALSSSDGQLTLAVRNDGIRFRRNGRRGKGMGLAIMNYRTDKIGGNLVVQAGKNCATEVICTVPLKHARVLHE